MEHPVIELKNITKRFAKVLANDNVSLEVNKGEVVALLGENGAGKSTIMKILYGLYRKTSGEIFIDGKKQDINSPKDAMQLGISMIQQHFSLVSAHTVTENIILGNSKGKIDYKKEENAIQELSDHYGFGVPAKAYIRDLPVGIQQKVEILKALHRKTRVLIMDEPTAVLIPQEIDILMKFIKDFVKDGNSVIFITHKMKEVMAVADRIVIMRDGKISGTVNKKDVTSKDLAKLMIGHELETLGKSDEPNYNEINKRVSVKNLSIYHGSKVPILDNLNFDIYGGEIFAIAGVSGNGQTELCETLYGALKPDSGEIMLDNKDVTNSGVAEHISLGIGYCAADRYRYAMVADMSLSENMYLKSSYLDTWSKNGVINWKAIHSYTEDIIKKYDIKAPDHGVTAGSLSGGNQQKVVVAREVDMGDNFIIFDQPTRGLDLGAINHVHKTILKERADGKSILLVSTELSEIFELADRIAVMYQGRFMGIFKQEELDIPTIGMLMAGVPIEEIKKEEMNLE